MVRVLITADSKFPVNRRRIRAVISRVLTERGVTGDVEVSVAVVGDRKMTRLNKVYKKARGTTDVLSFPYAEGEFVPEAGFVTPEEAPLPLGDIVVSYPQAVTQAIAQNKFVDDVTDFLVEHGLLHLLGIHHD